MNDDTTTSNDYSQAREDWLRAKTERLGMRLIVHGNAGLYTLTRPLDEDNQDGDCATYFVGWAGRMGPSRSTPPSSTWTSSRRRSRCSRLPGGTRSNAAVDAAHICAARKPDPRTGAAISR